MGCFLSDRGFEKGAGPVEIGCVGGLGESKITHLKKVRVI